MRFVFFAFALFLSTSAFGVECSNEDGFEFSLTEKEQPGRLAFTLKEDWTVDWELWEEAKVMPSGTYTVRYSYPSHITMNVDKFFPGVPANWGESQLELKPKNKGYVLSIYHYRDNGIYTIVEPTLFQCE